MAYERFYPRAYGPKHLAMMFFTDIRRRARDFYALRFEPDGVHAIADIYWRTLLCTAALIVVLALVLGLWELFGVFDLLQRLPDTSRLPPSVFNRATMQAIVQRFDARQTQFDNLQSNPPAAIPNPSK